MSPFRFFAGVCWHFRNNWEHFWNPLVFEETNSEEFPPGYSWNCFQCQQRSAFSLLSAHAQPSPVWPSLRSPKVDKTFLDQEFICCIDLETMKRRSICFEKTWVDMFTDAFPYLSHLKRNIFLELKKNIWEFSPFQYFPFWTAKHF